MELKERDRNEDAIRGKRKQGEKASPASSKCQLKTTAERSPWNAVHKIVFVKIWFYFI